MKVKKNDKVKVMRGKSRGKVSTVIAVDGDVNQVKVEKVNMVVKHVKKRMGNPGERVEKEAFLDASNVMVVCPSCNKPTRIGYVEVNGKKQRACKKCKANFA